MARVANNRLQGRRNQRGFLAAGLGIALFAVFSGIGAGVVANKEVSQDRTAAVAETEITSRIVHAAK